MKIVYYGGYTDWWGTYPPSVLDEDHGRTVGGGEAGMLMSAFGLAERGHDVVVYACAEPGEYRGVRFAPCMDYYMDGDLGSADAVVAWSDPWPLTAAPPSASRLVVQQLNDIGFGPGWDKAVDLLVSPAQDHAEYMKKLGYKGPTGVMHNGCDPKLWADAPSPASRPMQVGYWSSPDRGLHHVLRVWPRVCASVPSARLVVGYEIERLFPILAAATVRDYHLERLRAVRDAVYIARHDPSIEFIGAVSRVKLREVQQQTRVMAYPSDGVGYTEGFGVACLEAIAAGCLPVLRPTDALPSLWDGACRWTPIDTGLPGFDDELVRLIVEGLTEWADNPTEPSLEDLSARAAHYTWAAAADDMVRCIEAAKKGEDAPSPMHTQSGEAA